jgi:diacylglycerol kinase family enzyme
MSVCEPDAVGAAAHNLFQGKRAASVTCILNGSAGSGGAGLARERLAALFEQQGVPARIAVAKTGSETPLLAQWALKDGAGLVVAAGGDGTVGSVASALLNSEAVLGVIPLGTLNHFAKDLGIPLGLEEAVANLFTGRIAAVDAGEVNGHPFLNNSSLGLYPSIVRQREETEKKGHGKWLAFVAAVFYALRRYPRLYVCLRSKGESEIEEETPFVFVGNNRYEASGLRIGRRLGLNAGRLWVCSAPRAGRATLLRLALRALLGRPDPAKLKIFDAEECRIWTRKKHIPVATDGEVRILKGPLRYRILPRALKVVVPAAAVSPPPRRND